ncbi:hypothetical protein PIB30_014197 [Stylosanthes scabra]|uniref:Uncharacterized protein n=1 Tax=Stylosanthes scabra TaxID=79078 RepID=A0ABU6V6P2_9FABA|nr:hypothetical protein [Stylosanthes scabra]
MKGHHSNLNVERQTSSIDVRRCQGCRSWWVYGWDGAGAENSDGDDESSMLAVGYEGILRRRMLRDFEWKPKGR